MPPLVAQPDTIVETTTTLAPVYQVVLHNDDVNTTDHVVNCLMRVFGHSRALAEKIMKEAHRRGRAIAQVEAEAEALLHRDQLIGYSLSATVERI